MAWSYHFSKNTRFSTNTCSDQGRGSWTQDSGGSLDVERSWSNQGSTLTHHHCRAVCYQVAGDLLASGPSTRHSWLQWKCSLVYQRALCWLQMWFRLECAIGEIQPRCSWLHAGIFAPAEQICSYEVVRSSFRCDSIEISWDDGERFALNMAIRDLHTVSRLSCLLMHH